MKFSEIEKTRKNPPEKTAEDAGRTPAEGKAGPRPTQEPLAGPGANAPIPAPGPIARKPEPEPAPVEPAPEVEPSQAPPTPLELQEGHACYGRLIASVREAVFAGRGGPMRRTPAMEDAVISCLELLDGDPAALLPFASRSTAGNYLYAHSANVCILSLYLALGYDCREEDVPLFGLAALTHEVRLAELQGTPVEAGTPAAEQAREVALNPIEQAPLTQHLADLEKAFGPAGAHAAEAMPADLTLALHTVAICDLYEAMSHQRPWREPRLPHEAVKAVIRDFARVVDHRALQSFIEKQTLYPPGSYVELSSGELACVVQVSARTPTLPTVRIRAGADGLPVETAKVIDLATHPHTHIARPVDETKASVKDPRLAMALQAERWWVS